MPPSPQSPLATPAILTPSSEWVAPFDMTEDELAALCSEPYWRLRNLYWVINKDGRPVLFEPWPEQQKFFDNIWYRNVIPKARQRGFSTAVQIMMLDACVFVPTTAAAVIAQDDITALQIFEKKLKFAWDRLPRLIRDGTGIKRKNMHEMAWNNDSSIYVATSTRGATLQYLHVSEYGKICAQNPGHADEIQEGSLASVDTHGVIVIESTVETPYGHFSDMVRQAEKVAQSGRPLSDMDYRLHFASWWDAPEYETDPQHVVISPKDHAYFHRLEAAIGRAISPRKRAWYVSKRDNDYSGSNEKMWRQYPSTLKEAFTVSSDGLWLSEQMAKMRREQRIGAIPFQPGTPVNTFWDLRDNKVVWFHQKNGPWNDWIDYIEATGETYAHVVRKMQELREERGYVWGIHYLPHDGNTKAEGATELKTPKDMLEDLGLRRIEIIPRISDLTVGIDQLRQEMPTYRIDETRCAEGIKHMEGYAKVWNSTMATWTDAPAKNGHEHATDAIRQHAQFAHNMRGSDGPNRPKRRNRSGMAA